MDALTAADASQPPLWDGDGVDPWLPARMASVSGIPAAEQAMFKAWWGSFSEFLVLARRNVLTGGDRVDPHGVFAATPDWASMMGNVVDGPVKRTVGLSFEKLLGQDAAAFDRRPAVTAYLSVVKNRMVRTPEDVFARVTGEVARGAADGTSLRKVAQRVDALLDSTNAVENWTGRALVVTRTETLGALNFGRSDAFAEMDRQLGGGLQQQWLSTVDARTRPAHVAADGQRVAVGAPFTVDGEHLLRPGDPAGSAENVISCRCTTVLVNADEVLDTSNRGYATWGLAA